MTLGSAKFGRAVECPAAADHHVRVWFYPVAAAGEIMEHSLAPWAAGLDRRCQREQRANGPDYKSQIELAAQIKKIFQQTPGVVDVDWYVQDPQTKYALNVDLDKASLHGISPADVTRTLQVGLAGANAGLLHDPSSREDVPIEVRLARTDRSGIENLENLKLPTPSGGQIALGEVTDLQPTTIDTSVYRKNLQPVVYVTGDVAGGEESPVYAIMKMSDAIDQIKLPNGYAVKQYKGTAMPERTDRLSLKRDGDSGL